jgi:hypothetical protein
MRSRITSEQSFALCRFGLGCVGVSAESWPLFGWIMFTRTDTLVSNETQNGLDVTLVEIRSY